MIDLHCHILPGIDDGAFDMDESMEMARIAAADGIKKIVAAPHIGNSGLSEAGDKENLSEAIDEKIEHLKRCLEKEKIPIEILRGGEVSASLSPHECKPFTINRTAYLLVEFPYTHLPANAGEIIFNMTLSGLRPIISHPERNPSVLQNPEKLKTLIQSGALVQITASSLTGEFGLEYQNCALHLLREQMVSFIASDGHGTTQRPPILSRAFKTAKKRVGKKMAAALVSGNPEAVLEGRPVATRSD